MSGRIGISGLILFAFVCCLHVSAETPFYGEGRFQAADSLKISEDKIDDARQCLAELAWTPSSFEVQCTPPQGAKCDALVRFPSPHPIGDPVNDLVAMEWYVARDAQKNPVRAPAVVVVHESGSRMPVGRLIAVEFRSRGLHAIMIQLPYYGQRRDQKRPEQANFFALMRQAVADVRRARDAVAALPYVDASRIALQGTSLGGFIAATSASLDTKYDDVFLMLAGGDLYDIFQHGERDTAKMREELRRAGISDEQLKTLVRCVEPTRVCHRLDPRRTWLYSGTQDQVVPLKNALILAKALGLEKSHHVRMYADHYTGIVYLPLLIDQMANVVKGTVSTSAAATQ